MTLHVARVHAVLFSFLGFAANGSQALAQGIHTSYAHGHLLLVPLRQPATEQGCKNVNRVDLDM